MLLHVVTFDTPNALTVDSSWVDPATLSPIRMQSSNKFRVLDLEFGAGTVRATTTPAGGAPTTSDHPLAVRPFEWNMLPLALSSLPLRPGYTAPAPRLFRPRRAGGLVLGPGRGRHLPDPRQRLPVADVAARRQGGFGRPRRPVVGVAAAPLRGSGAGERAGGGDAVCEGGAVGADGRTGAQTHGRAGADAE